MIFNWQFQIGILLCSKGGERSISKLIYQKPSWTLRGEFYLGGVLFSQRKSILKQGEKISNLVNASQESYSFTFDNLQKNFEEDLQKNLQKQNMWCKRGPKCQKLKKQSMHIL
jgi:hypothetical protein